MLSICTSYLSYANPHPSWCGNDTPLTSAPSTECKVKCAGDKAQTCGGGNRLTVTSDSTWKQGFGATPFFQTWNLMGCYKDGTNGRLLKNAVSLSAYGGASNATIGNCMSSCQAKGYKYCGEEYASECYGSNTEPTLDLMAAGADPVKAGCSFPCKGNSAEVSVAGAVLWPDLSLTLYAELWWIEQDHCVRQQWYSCLIASHALCISLITIRYGCKNCRNVNTRQTQIIEILHEQNRYSRKIFLSHAWSVQGNKSPCA